MTVAELPQRSKIRRAPTSRNSDRHAHFIGFATNCYAREVSFEILLRPGGGVAGMAGNCQQDVIFGWFFTVIAVGKNAVSTVFGVIRRGRVRNFGQFD